MKSSDLSVLHVDADHRVFEITRGPLGNTVNDFIFPVNSAVIDLIIGNGDAPPVVLPFKHFYGEGVDDHTFVSLVETGLHFWRYRSRAARDVTSHDFVRVCQTLHDWISSLGEHETVAIELDPSIERQHHHVINEWLYDPRVTLCFGGRTEKDITDITAFGVALKVFSKYTGFQPVIVAHPNTIGMLQKLSEEIASEVLGGKEYQIIFSPSLRQDDWSIVLTPEAQE